MSSISKASYTTLMALELASIGIQYGGSDSNPFKQSTPATLLFLAAIFCHTLASIADMSMHTTSTITFIFHLSGVLASETLLWILVAEFWWSYILINVFLSLTASLCFSNSIGNILCGTASNADQMQNVQPQEVHV